MTEHAAPVPPSSPDLAAPAPTAAGDAVSATHGFLFADLRDYTGYIEAHGDRAGAALLERYRLLVRGVVAEARGAEVRTEGDSFYVVFGSVSAAVRAGLAILAAAAATAADPDPIRAGVGVHAGETVETADGFVGSAVNIAARLCAEAKAGELVVSETVRGLVRTSLEADFVPLGARRLKGVAEPVACYRVVARGPAPARTGRARPSVEGRRPWLLAVGFVAAVAAVGIGAAILLGGGLVAAPTPGPSAAALASPSASPAATAGASSQPAATLPAATLALFPSEDEAALLALLPEPLVGRCERGARAEDAVLAGFEGTLVMEGGQGLGHIRYQVTPHPRVGVTCRPEAGARRLYVMAPARPPRAPNEVAHLQATSSADTYISYLVGRWKIPEGPCSEGGHAYERWRSSRGTGLVACMVPFEGRPWIYFTFGDGAYLAFATRDDADYDALYGWWDHLKTFLP